MRKHELVEEIKKEMQKLMGTNPRYADEIVISLHGTDSLYEWFWRVLPFLDDEILESILNSIKSKNRGEVDG